MLVLKLHKYIMSKQGWRLCQTIVAFSENLNFNKAPLVSFLRTVWIDPKALASVQGRSQ